MNNHYVDYVMKAKCSPQLLPFFVPHKRARKEIMESMGCFMAAKNIDVPIKGSIVMVVGDGVLPRTGVVFALMSKPDIVESIDPIMDQSKIDSLKRFYQIRRINNFKGYAKEYPPKNANQRRVIIVLPHSHCEMNEAIGTVHNYSRLDIINLPCCRKIPDSFLTVEQPPKVYKDSSIHSDKNMVYVWEDYKVK